MTPEQRIDDLELRLEKHNAWMREAIVQRDRLALDAAWGVHYGLYSAIGVAVAIFLSRRYLDESGWLADVVTALAIFVIPPVVHVWSNGERMKEVEKLSELPEWEWKG